MIPLAIIGASVLAFRSYGWAGIAAVVTVLMFGILLHFSRMMQVLKRAANRPIGYVDSAVMLNAKLKPGGLFFIDQQIGFTRAAHYYFTQVPQILVILLPVSLLLALLFALGRMSRANEIVSMLTAGVKPAATVRAT